MSNVSGEGLIMREYYGWRRRAGRYWPAVVIAGAATAVVVGVLVPGWYIPAAAIAGAYMVFGGCLVDVSYRAGGYTAAAAQFLACAVVTMIRGEIGWSVIFLACALVPTFAAAVLSGPPPGKGGPVGPPASPAGEPPLVRKPGRMPADRRGGR